MSFMELFKVNPRFRIVGSRCELKPLSKHNLQQVKKWFKDSNLTRYAFGIIAEDEVLNKIARNYLRDIFVTSTEILGLWTEGKLVGFINYSTRKYQPDSARIGILLGKEENRGRGLGTEAMNLALLYLFDRVGLERVELDTALFNTRAQRCFEKCGFRRVRETTEFNFLSGETVHKIIMVIYREMFFENVYQRFEKLPLFEGELPPSLYLKKFTRSKR